MKFGRTFREQIQKEWRFYGVDYKALKKTLKSSEDVSDITGDDYDEPRDQFGEGVNHEEFFRILDLSKTNVSKFYADKEKWALGYMRTLEERVEALRQSTANSASTFSDDEPMSRSTSSLSSTDSEEEDSTDDKLLVDGMLSVNSPTDAMGFPVRNGQQQRRNSSFNSTLKDEYRAMGKSKHFQDFIYAKKSLTTFARELELLLEFLLLNKTAFSKILKKYDKRTGSSIREEMLAELDETHSFLNGETISELKFESTLR